MEFTRDPDHRQRLALRKVLQTRPQLAGVSPVLRLGMLPRKRQAEQALVGAGGQRCEQLVEESGLSLSCPFPGPAQRVSVPQDLLAGRDREAGPARHKLQVLRAGLDMVLLVLGQQGEMDAGLVSEVLLRLPGERPCQAHQPIPGSHPLLH